MLKKILKHIRQIRTARKFNIPFFRRATLKFPKKISLNNNTCELKFPLDRGTKNDYFGCFIQDDYGLRQLAFAPKTILDIGSNMGFFSVAARGYYPEALIHAYEPNPGILEFFEHQAQAAQFQHYCEAVGLKENQVNMTLDSGDSNQARTSASADGQIKQISLKQAIERIGGSVDLAKIDCEGAEWDLFKATDEWKNIGTIRMEYHLWETHKFTEVSDNIKRLGFDIIHHIPDRTWGIIWATKTNN